jgi:hypothetical protein
MTTAHKKTLFQIHCVIAAAFLLLPAVIWAQEEQGLEEVLSGFDEPEENEDELQDVLEGFDDGEQNNDETQDALGEEEVLEGFEDESEIQPPVTSGKSHLPAFLNLDGYFKLSSAYNLHSNKAEGTDTQWHGLSTAAVTIPTKSSTSMKKKLSLGKPG